MRHDPADSPESELVGGPIQQMREAVAAANPITYITRDDAPFFILHGDHDSSVPHQQSVLLERALSVAGVEVRFQTVPGGGQGGPAFQTEEIARTIVGFFDRHLKR